MLKPKAPTDSGKIPNDPELCVPTRVRALQDVVPVDVFVPGCPPDADVIFLRPERTGPGSQARSER